MVEPASDSFSASRSWTRHGAERGPEAQRHCGPSLPQLLAPSSVPRLGGLRRCCTRTSEADQHEGMRPALGSRSWRAVCCDVLALVE